MATASGERCNGYTVAIRQRRSARTRLGDNVATARIGRCVIDFHDVAITVRSATAGGLARRRVGVVEISTTTIAPPGFGRAERGRRARRRRYRRSRMWLDPRVPRATRQNDDQTGSRATLHADRSGSPQWGRIHPPPSPRRWRLRTRAPSGIEIGAARRTSAPSARMRRA